MGLKLSCIRHGSLSRQVDLPASPAPARVIAADGSLKELPASSPSIVSDVLGQSGGAASSSFFVCNSDALYFNERPPALCPGEVLRPGQTYFVLPAAMLDKPLSTADMAALAVRATTALASSSNSKPRRHGRRRGHGGGKKKAVRVMPVREEMDDGGEDVFFNEKLNQQTLGEFGMLLSPAKKDEKLAAAAATSRLKRALSIIQEDAE
ncbi:uncharacterized protein [Miscanthus floridulus]|uniref:uncharacterized protein n=1 Tax=Miscanthus floridulus TaxID=154761 RepID=UPI00345755C7